MPKGINGTVAAGAKLYEDKGCIACHGPGGSGGANVPLFNPAKIDRIEAPKSIGNFWAQATTVFDMIRRSMPWIQPRSLSDQEVYDLTAYVLFLNKLIDEKDVINSETLPKVKMPTATSSPASRSTSEELRYRRRIIRASGGEGGPFRGSKTVDIFGLCRLDFTPSRRYIAPTFGRR